MVWSVYICVNASCKLGRFKVHASNPETHMLPEEAVRWGPSMTDLYFPMRQRWGLSKMPKSVPQNELEDYWISNREGWWMPMSNNYLPLNYPMCHMMRSLICLICAMLYCGIFLAMLSSNLFFSSYLVYCSFLALGHCFFNGDTVSPFGYEMTIILCCNEDMLTYAVSLCVFFWV